MNHTEVVSRARQLGLGSRVPEIEPLIRPSIRILTTKGSDSAIAVGESKMGGDPDLPPGQVWPTRQGKPMSFLAQFNLAGLTRFDEERILPPAGLLSFFYDTARLYEVETAEDRSALAIHFQAPGVKLLRAAAPTNLDDAGRYAAVSVLYRAEATIPGNLTPTIESMGLSAAEEESYLQLLATVNPLADDRNLPHRFLGYAHSLQDDVESICQLMESGDAAVDGSPQERARINAILTGLPKWQLLLQVGSDEKAGMLWGDMGALYFLMPVDAMRTHSFGRARCVAQWD